MAASWMIVSGFLGALSNFCMRKSMDRKGTAAAFFVFQLFFTCIVAIALHPIRSGNYSWNIPVLLLGFFGGLTLGGFKWMLGYALQKGPPAITFATVNCASVMPAIIIVLLAGPLIDYSITFYDILGASIVIIGLLWAGWEKPEARSWYFFAALAFAMHVLFLIVWQWRALLATHQITSPYNWIPNTELMASEWFIPMVFAVACGIHTIKFINVERRLPLKWEALWGTLGGIFNGICAFFFMYAAEIASVAESTFIYSFFTISLIITCNLWGQIVYSEKVNWKANGVCIIGLLVAAH